MSRPFQNDQVWEASTTTFRWSSCDLLGPTTKAGCIQASLSSLQASKFVDWSHPYHPIVHPVLGFVHPQA